MEKNEQEKREMKQRTENRKSENQPIVIEKPKSKLDEIMKLGNQKRINSTFSRMNYP